MNQEDHTDIDFNIIFRCNICEKNLTNLNDFKMNVMTADKRKYRNTPAPIFHHFICNNCKYRNGIVYLLKHRNNKFLNDNNCFFVGATIDMEMEILKIRSNSYHFERVVSWDNYYDIYELMNKTNSKVSSYYNYNGGADNSTWDWIVLANTSSKIELDEKENYFVELYKPKLTRKLNNGLTNEYNKDYVYERNNIIAKMLK